jgi:hypothetical protein
MPPTANAAILDALTGHSVGVERYSEGLVRRMIGLLNNSQADLAKQIAARLAKSGVLGFDPGPVTTQRLTSLLEALRKTNLGMHQAIGQELTSELKAFAGLESAYSEKLLAGALPGDVKLSWNRPAPELLASAVEKLPMVGHTMTQEISALAESHFDRVVGAVQLGAAEGQSMPQIMRRIIGSPEQSFEDGVFHGNRNHLRTIVRTSTQHAANQARAAFASANADILAGEKWLATLDGRTTPLCQKRDGTLYPVGEGPIPPAHYQCLPGDGLVLAVGRVTGATKRRFDGEVVTIETASGNELTCTPNHPILTDGGWLAAGLVNLGDHVVSYRGGQRPAASLDHQGEHLPSRIQDVAEAFFASGAVRAAKVPTAPEDFHGDGSSSQVHVVATQRELGDRRDAALEEHSGELDLVSGPLPGGMSLPPSSGSLHPGIARPLPAAGLVGGTEQLLALLRRRPPPPLAHRVLPSADCDAGGDEQRLDGASGGAELLGDATTSADSAPRSVFTEDPGAVLLDALASGAVLRILDRNAPREEHAGDRLEADPEGLADRADARSCPVLLDDVVRVERRPFLGHVFNLQTESQLFIAGGIVVHNCRSVRVPVLKSWEELGLDGSSLSPSTRASMNGQVPASETYETWLRKQPHAFQDDVLGATKGQLFRSGGLTVDNFADASGKVYNLAQLYAMHPQAFGLAGLPVNDVWVAQAAEAAKAAAVIAQQAAEVEAIAKAAQLAADQAAADAAAQAASQEKRQSPRFSGLSEEVSSTLEAAELRIREDALETGLVVDSVGGRVIREHTGGSVNRVSFPPEDISGLRYAGGVMTHNHPSGGSFSVQDVNFWAANGLAEVRAVGMQGDRHVLYRLRWARESALQPSGRELVVTFLESQREARAAALRWLRKRLLAAGLSDMAHDTAGTLAREYYWRLSHGTMQRLADEFDGQLIYERIY